MLNRMSVRSKLSLLLIPPVLSLLAFAAMQLWGRWNDSVNASEMLEAAQVAKVASDVVHQNQTERALSAGYLSSNGQEFGSELLEQRSRTDTVLRELARVRQSSSLTFPRLVALLDELDHHLSRLEQMRSNIDSLRVDIPATLRYYNLSNEKMIGLQREISASASNAEISSLAQVTFRFMQAKEAAGNERSVLLSVFTNKAFDDALYARFQSLVALQDEHTSFFVQGAPETAASTWRQLQQTAAGSRTKELRAYALANRDNPGAMTIDPLEWFEVQSQKISSMRDLEQQVASRVEEMAQTAAQSANRDFVIGCVVVLATLVVTTLLTIQIVTGVVGSARVGLAAAERISEGRLDTAIDVDGTDEFARLGRAMSEMQHRISTIVSELLIGSDDMLRSSQHLTDHGKSLRVRASEQASAVQELATSMDEIAATTQESAKNAETAAKLARESAVHATEGTEIADKAMTAMGAIQEDARRIEDILDVINEIAFQTNILALNAAVEAARAGEQGRGFAVVAGEVQRLSERTSNSAKEVRTLIEESRRAVEEGSGWVGKSVERLRTISTHVHEVTDIVMDLANASREQSVALGQVNEALGSIDEVAQRNAAMVDEMGRASDGVREQATSTRELLSFFQVGALDDAGPPPPPAPRALLASPNHPAIDEDRDDAWQEITEVNS